MLPLPVGTVLGAITGGLIGLATETGVLRGTGVGGITGALVSMEVVESLWRSDEPAIWSVVYVVGGARTLSFRRPGRPVLISFLGLLSFSSMSSGACSPAALCARRWTPPCSAPSRARCVRAHHTVTESPHI